MHRICTDAVEKHNDRRAGAARFHIAPAVAEVFVARADFGEFQLRQRRQCLCDRRGHEGQSREDTAMIRLIGAAAAGLLCWLSFTAAQTMPTTAGPPPAAAVDELV